MNALTSFINSLPDWSAMLPEGINSHKVKFIEDTITLACVWLFFFTGDGKKKD